MLELMSGCESLDKVCDIAMEQAPNGDASNLKVKIGR
jgi:hypothetical protein